MFAWAGAGLAIVLGVGLLCVKAGGFPQRLSPREQAYASATSDTAFTNEVTTEQVLREDFIKIGSDAPAARPELFVWGDSFAMAALPAVDAYLNNRGLSGYAATHSSTAPVVGWYHRSAFGLNEKSIAFNNGVLSFVERRRVPHVLLVGSWRSYVVSEMNTSGAFEASLLATVRRLVAMGAHPWILLEVPTYTISVPRLLSVPIYSDEYITSLQERPGRRESLAVYDPDLIQKLEEAGALVLDPKPRFVDPASGKYRFESDGVALYRDGGHLSVKGSKIILLPLLRDAMATAPRQGRPAGRAQPE